LAGVDAVDESRGQNNVEPGDKRKFGDLGTASIIQVREVHGDLLFLVRWDGGGTRASFYLRLRCWDFLSLE
jgi:hypothetical protein